MSKYKYVSMLNFPKFIFFKSRNSYITLQKLFGSEK